MMTAKAFKNAWEKTGEPTSPLSADLLAGLGLAPATEAFLTEAGLPYDAAPFLSFVRNAPEAYNRIARLSDLFDTAGGKSNYISIGSDGEGNVIAIDTAASDRVEWLDHEADFAPKLMNTTVNALAASLLHYRDFIERVNAERGEDAYLDGNFSEDQWRRLRADLAQTDPPAVEQGFWQEELQRLRPERQDSAPKPWWKFW